MFKVLALGLLLGSAAHADIVIKSVALTASNELNLTLSDTGPDVTLKLKDLRRGGDMVTATADALTVEAQRFDDLVAIMTTPTGSDRSQLDLFQPSNGEYKAILLKPIPDRMGVDDDFAEVMRKAQAFGWSSADTFATMADWFKKNPSQKLFNFRLKMENNRVTPVASAPASATAAVSPAKAPASAAPMTAGATPSAAASSPATNVPSRPTASAPTPAPPNPSRFNRPAYPQASQQTNNDNDGDWDSAGTNVAPVAPVAPVEVTPGGSYGGYAKPGGWFANRRTRY